MKISQFMPVFTLLLAASPLWTVAAPLSSACKADLSRALKTGEWPVHAFLESGRHDSARLQIHQAEQALQQAGIRTLGWSEHTDEDSGRTYFRVAAILTDSEDAEAFLEIMDQRRMPAGLIPTASVGAGSEKPRLSIEELREKFLGKSRRNHT